MARENDVNYPQPDNVSFGSGASIFGYVGPVNGQVAITILPRGTSGTIEIAGAGPSFAYASTFAITGFTPSLLANGTGFLVPSTGYTINGPAAFWLSQNTGATVTVSLLRLINLNRVN